jgi:CDP-glycerol glycerophosphotransferase
MDFGRANELLGDAVVFLVRGHHNVVDNGGLASAANVIDVSEYPQINDLFVASDSLITDYSSCMFDYSLTGKPISLLVPDLEEYESKTRGFYLPFNEIAPGDVYLRSEELLKGLSHRSQLDVRAAGVYDKFVERFAGQDRGFSATLLLSDFVERGWLKT